MQEETRNREESGLPRISGVADYFDVSWVFLGVGGEEEDEKTDDKFNRKLSIFFKEENQRRNNDFMRKR